MTQTPELTAASLESGNSPGHDVQTRGAESPQARPSTTAVLYDYRQAANPVRPGLTEPIPYRRWSPELHGSGPSAIVPLDLSGELGLDDPATSPALAAHFIRIQAGEALSTPARATSSLFFVLSGSGRCLVIPDQATEVAAAATALPSTPAASEPTTIPWQSGDLFVLPCGGTPQLEADATSVLYWVHDAPLLRYLGVTPSEPRFSATHYPGAWLRSELQTLAADPGSARSNRLSLLLGNSELPSTRTVTHVLWAMFGLVPAGATQPPHRHQSVALDLIVDCQPGCYTLVGTELNTDGSIRNPQRIDWEPGGAFITPPGHWHAHSNESGSPAWLLPIQDAGLHTHLRSLDIRFA